MYVYNIFIYIFIYNLNIYELYICFYFLHNIYIQLYAFAYFIFNCVYINIYIYIYLYTHKPWKKQGCLILFDCKKLFTVNNWSRLKNSWCGDVIKFAAVPIAERPFSRPPVLRSLDSQDQTPKTRLQKNTSLYSVYFKLRNGYRRRARGKAEAFHLSHTMHFVLVSSRCLWLVYSLHLFSATPRPPLCVSSDCHSFHLLSMCLSPNFSFPTTVVTPHIYTTLFPLSFARLSFSPATSPVYRLRPMVFCIVFP